MPDNFVRRPRKTIEHGAALAERTEVKSMAQMRRMFRLPKAQRQ